MHTSTVILSLAAVCLGAKLPPTFKRCKKDSSDADRCLSAAVEDALRRLTAPFDDVGLPSLDPLDVPALTIGAGTGPVGVEQKFKDLKLYGFTKPGSIKF
ncbi:JHBP domain containing protein, partial [Asbolus verrucosus]